MICDRKSYARTYAYTVLRNSSSRPVQPRQGLHGGDTRQLLVDIHAHQQRLVEPGLELVRDDHHLKPVAGERGLQRAAP
jgi:hypothetical protein